MILSLLLAGSLAATGAQDTSQVQALVRLAAVGPQESLVAEVGRYPDAARDAFGGLLRQSVSTAERPTASTQDHGRDISDAETLARAYFEAWTDAFLIQELGRFRMWSLTERRAKLAADSIRLAGNDAYGRIGISQAMSLWRQGLEASRTVGDEPGVFRVLGNIGAGWYSAGDLDSARAYLTESYRGATGVNDLRTAAAAVTNLANLAYELNDLPHAADLYSQASDLLARTGS